MHYIRLGRVERFRNSEIQGERRGGEEVEEEEKEQKEGEGMGEGEEARKKKKEERRG